jgi:hypothetical protein
VTKIGYALPAALLLLLTGCTSEDPNAVAAAKCVLPLRERVGTPDDGRLKTSNVRVRDLGKGRRQVTGLYATGGEGGLGSFVCVVTPDASDQLRGLRVERLDVQAEQPDVQ